MATKKEAEPTTKQRDFASDLGLNIPVGITRRELSVLISQALKNEGEDLSSEQTQLTTVITCQHCEKRLTVEGHAFGEDVICPLCNGLFSIPEQSEEEFRSDVRQRDLRVRQELEEARTRISELQEDIEQIVSEAEEKFSSIYESQRKMIKLFGDLQSIISSR